jgi:alkylation response protein AidB-like acyl-CoA dehydrogenase
MNFDLSPEQMKIKDAIAAFCIRETPPEFAANLDKTGEFPHELYRKFAASGFFGIPYPAKYGGADGDLADVVIVAEQLASCSLSVALIYLIPVVFAGMFVLANGTEEQKAEIIPKLINGDLKFSFSMSERDAGSDPKSIKTAAVAKDNGFIVSGTKYWTTGASVADYLITVVLTSGEGDPGKGMTVFMAPTATKGLSITPIPTLAMNAYPACEVVFEGVTLSKESIVGGATALNKGWDQLRQTADLERVCIAACCIGAGETVLKECVAYARQRRQFNQPIMQFQAIQHTLADMATDLEAMRWMTYHAAWMRSQGRSCFKEISMAKLFCTEALNGIVKRGMQIFGGKGYSMEHHMQRYLREAYLYLYAGGTSEIQKTVISRFL